MMECHYSQGTALKIDKSNQLAKEVRIIELYEPNHFCTHLISISTSFLVSN